MRVLVPLGTRPEIVKLAPVVAALRAASVSTTVIATGQHHDPSLTDAFFGGLGLEPDVRWTLRGSEPERVGSLVEQAFDAVADRKPDVILLLGDTYTVPFFCLAARRWQVPVAHLEAGLRSWNETSMEEVNRRVAGAIASLHLAPTQLAARFLQREGVAARRIRVVGNPIIDVLRASGRPRRPTCERSGVVVTAHRATNVDDPERLAVLVRIVRRLADEVGRVTFPLHPRTQNRLELAGALDELDHPDIDLLPPLPWDQMLDAIAAARVVITDSGGLQEEASFFGVPVVVLRRSTPRWEGVTSGAAVLTGLDDQRAIRTAVELSGDDEQQRVASIPCPYGDGRTSERVARLLADPASAGLLALDEPDLRDCALPW